MYCDNTGSSKITNETTRAMLLNMLTAHIAKLEISKQVGRVSSASEGSVSVSLDVGVMSGTAAWFMATNYGMAFWQATAQYRMARVYQGNPRNIDPYNPYIQPT